MKGLFIILMVICLIMLCSCGQNKPSKSELRSALNNRIPNYLEVIDFSVEASKNLGNEVEPAMETQFSAVVKAKVDLFIEDTIENEILFVRKSSKSGSQTSLLGKITSKFYQGAWKHDVDIDCDLGVPFNVFSGNRVIARGSEDDKKYHEELERKEEELRNNIAKASEIFVGSWKADNGSVETYRSDGVVIFKPDNYKEYENNWKIEDDILSYSLMAKEKLFKQEYRIEYLDENNYTRRKLDEPGRVVNGKRTK